MPTWGDLVLHLRLDVLSAVLLSILLGGAIGLEREFKGKAAGLRTNILICMGAALFTQVSIAMAGDTADRTRIAAQIVTGVGFLGAGTILHGKGSITGLTSAATIWLVAAIGTAAGAGEGTVAAGTTLIALLVLRVLGWAESYVQRRGGVSRMTVQLDTDPARVAELEQMLRASGVEVESLHSELQGDKVLVGVTLRGPRHAQDQARLKVLRATGAYSLSVED
jgi:putative Mg2+ transporter-C (MgtC) family protein